MTDDFVCYCHNCSVEFHASMNECFCIDGMPLRSNGKPLRASDNIDAMLLTVERLQLHDFAYKVPQAVLFLFLYKSLLLFYRWKHDRCTNVESFYNLTQQQKTDVEKIVETARKFRRKSEELPPHSIDCATSITHYFHYLLDNTDGAEFDPEKSWNFRLGSLRTDSKKRKNKN